MVSGTASGGAIDRLRGLVGVFWREMAKFGIVGAVGFIIDFGGFNLLFYNPGPLAGHITTAKIVSGVAATMVTWVGNRLWTFRHRRNRAAHHEAMLFFAVNGVGLVISAGWLALTHYAFHMDSRVAVNLNTIVGIGLATVFRFWAYRQFVFAGEHPGDIDAQAVLDEAAMDAALLAPPDLPTRHDH